LQAHYAISSVVQDYALLCVLCLGPVHSYYLITSFDFDIVETSAFGSFDTTIAIITTTKFVIALYFVAFSSLL